MKTHVNLPTRDLEQSVRFYRALLQIEPFKKLDDYALFVSDDPGLELALSLSPLAEQAGGAHFGIVVDSVDAVDGAIARLQAHGLETSIEREETCCYAKQTKVWASDPDGNRWEVYTVHEEADAASACC
jgi:catechol 2,3-dioxygenase-like lactoylglutathione lyase family enzyme